MAPIKRFLWLLAILPLYPAQAAWTGISAFVGEERSDWTLAQAPRVAESLVYGLSVEEKTRPGLRIGLAGGRFSLDIESPDQTLRDEYDGEFLQLYLRWPFKLSERFTLHSRFDYRIHHGKHENPLDDNAIEWSERSIDIGLAYRHSHVSLHPFIRLRTLDGDVETSLSSGVSFKSSESLSHGLIIDLHVESTAHVRLRAEFAAVESLQMHFVRAF